MTIKEIREAKGLTQSELAAVLGTTQAMVSRWEKGTTRPGVESLRKIAALAECGMDDIEMPVRQLRARDVFAKDTYECLTAQQRRQELKLLQAGEYSGWGRYPTTCSKLLKRIPAEWWDKYTAQHIGEVMAMLKTAYDDGRQNPSPDEFTRVL